MEDTKRLNAWVLGGDGRYPWAAEALRASGLPVKTWGVPGMEDQADGPEAALAGADVALLPMKPFRGETLCLGMHEIPGAELPRLLGGPAILIAGSFPEELERWLVTQGVQCRSLLELEGYQTANAAVTAEGAVYLTLRELSRTLHGAEVLVIGWGRIGKLLAGKLKALGAHVTVAARRERHWQELEALGLRPEETGKYHHGLESYDAVLNTVPAQVLTAAQAARLRPGCVRIELASPPGGFPVEEQHVVMARGLPALTAPETAGKQLAQGVWDCLAGEGRTLE